MPPPPKPKPKATGLRLVKGVPVESLLKWQPPAELVRHCHALLGLTPDGRLAPAGDGRYVPPEPEGTDARSPHRPAE